MKLADRNHKIGEVRFHILTILLLAAVCGSFAQDSGFGDSTSFFLGGEAKFFAGGNTTFNGSLSNNGTIVSFSDLDFTDIRQTGDLKFVGDEDQQLVGDTLFTSVFKVDKMSGDLLLLSDRVFVTDSLDVSEGQIQAEEGVFVVRANTMSDGMGFVVGPMFGQRATGSDLLTFPVGVNDLRNYLTIYNLDSDSAIVRVECIAPDPQNLEGRLDEEMSGLGEEAGWTIQLVGGDSTTGELQIDYSGIDLAQFESEIESDYYKPVIVILYPGDSVFRALENPSDPIERIDLPSLNAGIVTTTESIRITRDQVRLLMALIPVPVDPVLYIPDAFAPASLAEENRIFRPFFEGGGAEITEIVMVVWDAFGAEVYNKRGSGLDFDNTTFGWDGMLSTGLPAPDGVYNYQITVAIDDTSNPDFPRTEVGGVLLVR